MSDRAADREAELLAEKVRRVQSGTEHFVVIVLLLPRLSNLRELTLNYLNIDDDMAIGLANAMQNCVNITRFDVQYNRIQERGFAALTIRVRIMIIILYWPQPGKGYENRMSLNNLRELLRLPSPLPPYRLEFDANKHVMIERQIYLKVGVLCVQSLCLSEMHMGDEGAVILANSFSIMVNLRVLYFYRNEVGAVGANAFTRMLPNARVLGSFDLKGNSIPPEYSENRMNQSRQAAGLEPVAVDLRDQRMSTAVKSNTHPPERPGNFMSQFRQTTRQEPVAVDSRDHRMPVHDVDIQLSEMNLSDEGAVLLANSFSPMERLFFYRNGVCGEGTDAFAGRLPDASVLRSIDLTGNLISPEHVKKFELMNQLRRA